MDEWYIYNLLKNKRVTENDVKKVERLDGRIVKDGIIEYLLTIYHQNELTQEEKEDYKS